MMFYAKCRETESAKRWRTKAKPEIVHPRTVFGFRKHLPILRGENAPADVPPLSRRCPATVSPVSRHCPATVPPLSRHRAATVPPLSRHCPTTVRRCPTASCQSAIAARFARPVSKFLSLYAEFHQPIYRSKGYLTNQHQHVAQV